MASHSQSTGWVTSKPSKSSAIKPKKTTPRLHQSSLHDYIKRKPKTTGTKKENKGLSTTTKSTKRKQSVAHGSHEEGVVPKKRTKLQDARNPVQDGLADEPPRYSENLGTHRSSPILVSDDQDVVSWDDTTVWDSAITSRTIRVEPSSCTPKGIPEVEKRSKPWSGDAPEPFKVPASPTAFQLPSERILAPDTPARINRFSFHDDDPFIASPSNRDGSRLSRQTEIIPSSQSQEVLHIPTDFPSPSSQISEISDMHFTFPSLPGSAIRLPQSCQPLGTISDEEVPSSQSQYLLPYKASPLRNHLATDTSNDSGTVHADIVPSSQILEELELKVPSPFRRGWSTSSLVSPSVPRGSNTPMTQSNKPKLTPKRPGPTSFSMHSPLPSPDLGISSRSTPLGTGTILVSPPPMTSSQHSYLSSDASYPLEVKNFLNMVDEDRHSLGSDFYGSFKQSLVSEAPLDEMDDAVVAAPANLPSPKHRTNSPNPLFDPSLSLESIPTQRLSTGHDSQYTFVEETCPPAVLNFMDMLGQDRDSLGTQFQESM